MFSWVADAIAAIGEFIGDALLWLLSLPVKLINALIDLWYWMREETLNTLGNLLWDSFSVIASLSPYPLNVNQDTFNSIYVNANVFFPVDDMIVLAVFLLETWIMVKVARYSTFLALVFFKPRKPNFKLLDSGE